VEQPDRYRLPESLLGRIVIPPLPNESIHALPASSTVLEGILAKAREAWEAGRLPSAIRLNENDLIKLSREAGDSLRRGRTSRDTVISAIHTEWGVLQMVVDPHMPEGCFIVQVRHKYFWEYLTPGSEDAE
jgi:hypothetical protein